MSIAHERHAFFPCWPRSWELREMIEEEERLRRWRLVLGGPAGDLADLSQGDQAMGRVLDELYDAPRSGGLQNSAPAVARWLGDIRTYFPSSVVRVMQQDAMERLRLRQMLLQPEMLESMEPDIHLVATLLSLSRVIPEETKDAARSVVRRLVDEVQRRLALQLAQAVRGSLRRTWRSRRPRHHEIVWDRTIRANLRHYQPKERTILLERLVGQTRHTPALRDLIVCVDQSGSMAASVVYSGIFASVMASLPALRTRMVVFDTAVVDLSEELHDPVDLLFGVRLGGGTDINRALAYCQTQIVRPVQTVLLLVTDLFEGGNTDEMLARAKEMVESGVQVICLLSLSDTGTPAYDAQNAASLASLGVPTFACTPDLFPDMIAAALARRDLDLWAASQDIVAVRGEA
jgi:Mg-chelatase subunit ChlD